MDRLPLELSLKVFCLLDQRNLANAQLVCRHWKELASDNTLWCNLFKKRWGTNPATFFAPSPSKSWKEVYEVQDRCDRVGLGLQITREGSSYYLVHQGQIQRCLGTRKSSAAVHSSKRFLVEKEEETLGLLDEILFFSVDLQMAISEAKRARV